MLAPVLVSPPYAAGKTIVFNPSGVAYAKRASVIISFEAPKSSIIISITDGIAMSLNAAARYIRFLVRSVLSL